jgi:hypothetical protein
MGRSFRSGLSGLAIVFVAAWAIRSLIVTGDAVLNQHPRQLLTTRPATAQVAASDNFTQSLIRASDSLPKTEKVLVYWSNPPDRQYLFFWATYWLFPRPVTVTTSIDASLISAANVILVVRRPNDPEPDLSGFTASATDTHPDLVVTTYTRSG